MPSKDADVLSIAQMRAWEDAAVAAGSSYAQLMENAGAGAAADVCRRFDQPQAAWIVCGQGNNGGDGLVMARYLAEVGWPVTVCLLQGSVSSTLARDNLARLSTTSVCVVDKAVDWRSIQAHVLVDAVFGTGFRGHLPSQVAQCMAQLALLDAFKVALDMPSGIHGDNGTVAEYTMAADVTYVFHALKTAHTLKHVAALCGELVRIDLG